MSAEVLDLITPLEDGKYRVQCLSHGDVRRDLDRIVDSQQHAVNLEAKHIRQYHAGARAAGVVKPDDHPVALDDLELNLTNVVPLVTMAHTVLSHGDPDSELAAGFIAMWEALTGVQHYAAIELAREIQASRVPVRAAVIPL